LVAYHCGRAEDIGSEKGAAPLLRYRETGGVPARGESSALGKIKNRGNEAKKWLKTKDITFLNAANYARFARKLTPIAH
jgi:hypothetical protein